MIGNSDNKSEMKTEENKIDQSHIEEEHVSLIVLSEDIEEDKVIVEAKDNILNEDKDANKTGKKNHQHDLSNSEINKNKSEDKHLKDQDLNKISKHNSNKNDKSNHEEINDKNSKTEENNNLMNEIMSKDESKNPHHKEEKNPAVKIEVEMTEITDNSKLVLMQASEREKLNLGGEPPQDLKILVRHPIDKDNPAKYDKLKSPDFHSQEKRLEDEAILGKMILDLDKGFLVDEQEYDGSAKDNINDPETLQRLEEEIELQHPKRRNKDGSVVPYQVCHTSTGNMGCTESQSKSDLEPLGLGMVIYFKILKAFTIVFFLIVVLNIPLYYIYQLNHPEYKAIGYKDYLFKTTIGNIGSTLANCQKIPTNNIMSPGPKIKNYTFHLDCQGYNISSITTLGLTSDYLNSLDNNANCQNFTANMNITVDSQCSLNTYMNSFITTTCLYATKCDITVDLAKIQQGCTVSPKHEYFFMVYNCYDNLVDGGYGLIQRKDFAFIVVLIDIGSMVSLLVCLLVIAIAQRKTNKFFKENVILICDYTIHFKNLNLKQDKIYNELDLFVQHLYSIHHIDNPGAADSNIIYDINYPVITDKKLDLIIDKNNITELINEKRNELNLNEKYYSPTKLNISMKYLQDLKLQEEKIREEINKSNMLEMKNINDVYVTFTTQRNRNHITSEYSRGCCKRCCLICWCQSYKIKHLYFKNKWVNYQEQTDQPSNIKWQNVPYSSCLRLVRQIFSFTIALIVILASFGIVIGTKYAQEEINKTFNTSVDCKYIDYTDAEVTEEFNDPLILMRSKVKTSCFCRDTLYSKGYSQTKDISLDGTTTPCSQWVTMYIYSQSLMIGTFILVPIVNIILSIVLAYLTICERNKSESVNSSSRMWKSFLLQLINTAVVILLVNVYIQSVVSWDPNFPLFTGMFTDLDPAWYQNVGVTIVFFMVLNVISPHIAPLLSYITTKCKRSCDRNCCPNGRKTKRKTRKEFADLYTGPEFDIGARYSQVLNTIFVTLIYSSGMPILYVGCFCFFIFTYWVDKLMILRFYKNPPHIDLFISKLFNMVVLFGVIIHYGFGIWTYGNPNILTNTTNTAFDSVSKWIENLVNWESNSFAKNILTRITLPHNILCFAFLIFIVLVFVWRLVFMDFVLNVLFCCSSEDDVEKTKDLNIYDGKNNLNNIFLAIRLKGLYFNHQLRKAQYFKMRKAAGNFPTLKDEYFINMIELDRMNIKKKLVGMTTEAKFDLKNNKNFDQEIPQLMKNLSIKETAPIHNEYSYNITFIPAFRDVAYFEFIVPFLSKDN